MLKKLRKTFRRSARFRSLNAQVEELNVAVAALMRKEMASDGAEGADVERVLIHAAKARVESEAIKSLYESLAGRVVATEQQIDAMREKIRMLEEKSQ